MKRVKSGTSVNEGPLSLFHEPVRRWFEQSLGQPTRVQALGWVPIAAGESTLLLAPTGSGKTLAAFLAALEKLMWSPAPPKGRAKAPTQAEAIPLREAIYGVS